MKSIPKGQLTTETIKDSWSIEFFIPGVPQPGGSKKAFTNPKTGRPIIVEDAKKNKEWRAVVALAAKAAMKGRQPTKAPIEIEIIFYMPRPKSHYRTGKYSGVLRPSAPRCHTIRPDVTKLVRSTEDAMTGIVWYDDSQIFSANVKKIYSEYPGALITLRTAPNIKGGLKCQ